MASLTIRRSIGKAKFNLGVGIQPGEVILSFGFPLPLRHVVELFACCCQFLFEFGGFFALPPQGFGGTFCRLGCFHLLRQCLFVVPLAFTEPCQLLVEQLYHFFVLVFGHSHAALVTQIFHALLQLFHEGLVLFMSFDLFSLFVQVSEGFLKLSGGFCGSFCRFAVAHEP